MRDQITAGFVALVLALSLAATGCRLPAADDNVTAANRGDYATAMQIFRSLADQGDARALSNLGVMYHMGRGVPQDNVQAYKWFTLAGAVSAASQVADEMTPAQIAEAKRLAHEWKPTK